MHRDLHTISWLHFGDLHITTEGQQNYRDFLALIAEANQYIAGSVDFAVLPGDNADDGTQDEYRLIARAIAALRLPLETRVGDHDRKSGTLKEYQQLLEPRLWHSRIVGNYRCLFLNSLDGPRNDAFDIGAEQLAWIHRECEAAQRESQLLALFLHAYPSEHGNAAHALSAAIARYSVAVVDMGHTHYNELANDGRTIYAATRSTGQIEEGGVGFSITTIDRGVVSWKFHQLGQWPLVKITSPADQDLIIDATSPLQVVRGAIEVRARVWGNPDIALLYRINDSALSAMQRIDTSNVWRTTWDSTTVPDGVHRLVVQTTGKDGEPANDAIGVRTSQSGAYELPLRSRRDLDNVVDARPERGLLGTRLGPNANGRKW